MTNETTHLQARVKVLEEQFSDYTEVALDPVGAWNLITALRAALAASIPADPVTNAGCCQSAAMQMMETAPQDGSVILVWYDHDADPYQDPDNPDRLTDYAVWCEGGDFMKGRGYCLACWEPPFFESTDEYGSGFWLPAWWFKEDENERVAVNPVRWMPLPLNELTAPTSNAGCCQAPSPPEHYDDYCIRQFAKLMSEKMAASRAKGRSGWHDPEKCSVEYLRSLLYEHLDKGDPVDVANFCMMLRHYNASTYREFCNCTPKPAPVTLAEALQVPEVQALVEAAMVAKLALAEHEPHPLPACQSLLAALRPFKGGKA